MAKKYPSNPTRLTRAASVLDAIMERKGRVALVHDGIAVVWPMGLDGLHPAGWMGCMRMLEGLDSEVRELLREGMRDDT